MAKECGALSRPDQRPSGPEPAQRPSGPGRRPRGRRRYAIGTATLVVLASAPMLAVVMAGSAALEPPSSARSPFVASRPDRPVIVGTGQGDPASPSAPTDPTAHPPADGGCRGYPTAAAGQHRITGHGTGSRRAADPNCGYPDDGVSLDLRSIVIHVG